MDLFPRGPEFRLALRATRRTPLLSLTAALSIAIGLGLCTAAFTILRDVAAGRLPVPDDARVVALTDRHRDGYEVPVEPAEFARRRDALTTVPDLAGYRQQTVLIGDAAEGGRVARAALVTVNAFDVLRVAPVAGRGFDPDDAAPGALPTVLLTQGFARLLGMEPAAAAPGREVVIGGERRLVIGVMPPGFRFPYDADLWLPLPLTAGSDAQPLRLFGRLTRNTHPRAAQAELAVIVSQVRAPDVSRPDDLTHRVVPFTRAGVSPAVEGMLVAVVVALGLLLAVTAANVANLLLARTAARAREIAVRTALGASRTRVALQLFLEASVITAGGTVVGLAGAVWGLAWFRREVTDLPFWADLTLDPLVLAFAAGLALVASAIAAFVPARRATAVSVSQVLRERAGGFRFGRLSAALVAVELAVAVGFLSGAAALGRGLLAFGFGDADRLPADRVLVAQLYHGQPPALEGAAAPTDRAARRRAWDAYLADVTRDQRLLAERLQAAPGVRAVAFADRWPGNEAPAHVVEIEGGAAGAMRGRTRLAEIGPGFFDVLDTRLVRGRRFHPDEHAGSGSVAIVNQSFADRFFGGADPLGRRVRLVSADDAAGLEDTGPWLEIVGVAPDLGLNPGDPGRSDGVYLPLPPTNVLRVAIRTDGNPAALVPALHQEVLGLPHPPEVQWAKSLTAQLAEPVALIRGFGVGLTTLGGIALLLACAGVFAILALAVNQRRPEIALRVALGARPAGVVRAVLRRSAWQIGAGATGGVFLGVVIQRLLGQIPYDIASGGVAALAGATVLLAAAGLVACWFPVRRALRIEPMEALRETG